jgi:hypothetical protein
MIRVMSERENVQAFIDSSGFPLEFAAARTLHAVGFLPRHGRTYEVPQAGPASVFREIDVVADLYDQRLELRTRVVLECKHAVAPWVVIGGDQDSTAVVLPIIAHDQRRDGERVARGVRTALGIVTPLSFAIHQIKSRPGNQPDPAFDAVRQAVSAAQGAASVSGDEVLTYPLVVLGGSLWRYRPGAPVEQVDAARLVWWSGTGGSATPVDVVTEAGFTTAYALQLRDELVALSQAVVAVPPEPRVF